MVNSIVLVGRVGKDPVVKNFDNGGKIAEFSLATDDSYKDKQGNKVEQTDWHNVKFNGKLAEVVEKYVKKGGLVYVSGKIKTRSYDDKDGNKRYVTEVVADTLKMLGGKEDNSATVEANQKRSLGEQESEKKTTSPDDDGLPF